MARYAAKVSVFIYLISTLVSADDRIYFEAESERRWNTPPKLTPGSADGKSNLDNDSTQPQPRFLPFSASFSLSAGGDSDNAHSLSVGGNQDGISFSQSASQSGGSSGNLGSGISASQSSSFSAGLSGFSAADSNAFNVKHRNSGENSQANSNSFALGEASSAAQGNVVNGQASSGAQSVVGSFHTLANSGTSSNSGSAQIQGNRQGRPVWTNISPNYEFGGVYNPYDGRPKLHVGQGGQGWPENYPRRGPIQLDVSIDEDRWHQRRPEVVISDHRPSSHRGYRGNRQGATSSGLNYWDFNQDSSDRRESWTQGPLTGPAPQSWSQIGTQSNKPSLQISGSSASSSASSSSGGSSFGQSSAHSDLGSNRPLSWTKNNVQTSGNAQSHAQGAAAAVGQNFYGNTQASFSLGTISGSSQNNGQSHGNAASGSRGETSRGQVTSHATGNGHVQGTANSGSISFVKFPGDETSQNLPNEFVRSQQFSNTKKHQQRQNSWDPVGKIIGEFTDAVTDLFEI